MQIFYSVFGTRNYMKIRYLNCSARLNLIEFLSGDRKITFELSYFFSFKTYNFEKNYTVKPISRPINHKVSLIDNISF